MSNFAFLQQEWPDLFQPAQKSESLAMSDPRTCCFYGRRTLELAVQWLYKNDAAFGQVYDNNLGALIAHASFRQNVPDPIYSKARLIHLRVPSSGRHDGSECLPCKVLS